jgi:hypothetical protein
MFGAYCSAQTAIASQGGDVQSSEGSVSYTLGQVAYDYSHSATGSVSAGVQQSYIETVGIDNYPEITLFLSVYPNPASHFVVLRISAASIQELKHLRAYLYDISGNELQTLPIRDLETQIDLESLATSVYFLKVVNNKRTLKTFKIVKQ